MTSPVADPLPRAVLIEMLRAAHDRIHVLEREADYWYARTLYSRDELEQMYRRASRGFSTSESSPS